MLKVNLIIDGNYLLYKDVFILKKTRTIREDLPTLLRKDFKVITGSYSFDNIFFVSDKGKSWRKEYLSDKYKAQRVKDETINWNLVFEEYDLFKQELKENPKCNFIELDSLEGDDIIAGIINTSNKQGYSNVIIAADSDLHQLIKYNLEPLYINCMWNYKYSNQCSYFPEHYKVFKKELDHLNNNQYDIFNLNNDTEFSSFLDHLILKTKVEEVSSEKALFCKMITGDSGDNISGIVKIKDGKLDEINGTGIGETGADKCYTMYKDVHPESIDVDTDEFIDRAVEIGAYYKKVNSPAIKKHMREKLKLNRSLIFLKEEYIPLDVRKSIHITIGKFFENKKEV